MHTYHISSLFTSDGQSTGAGPAVHTRSGQPIPAISLSTELPELSELTVADSPQTEAELPAEPGTDVAELREEDAENAANANAVELGEEDDGNAANVEEEVLPAEVTMSTALETAEAVESEAIARAEALAPSPSRLPHLSEVPPGRAADDQIEGTSKQQCLIEQVFSRICTVPALMGMC